MPPPPPSRVGKDKHRVQRAASGGRRVKAPLRLGYTARVNVARGGSEGDQTADPFKREILLVAECYGQRRTQRRSPPRGRVKDTGAAVLPPRAKRRPAGWHAGAGAN
ncbi:hypothetical protein EYF80_056474 [Liparis tanakae]|uniref:Uncharacterized protein n=1 Tax=Liparis tanakae TaxID=230148 RepID=A0A4Z2EWX2_9TELE|nr:hypothetical protein EYF80_056474 [Liparis tanakae]